MFESELSNGIELDEDELPEFLQLEGKCSCRDKYDCPSGKVCVTGNCNTRKTSNIGQCKNKKNKSVDDVLEELIAEEDEKAAELSNGIEFVEEENRRCDRSSECPSHQYCDRGRCQKKSRCDRSRDCRSRKSEFVLFCCVLWCVQYEDSVIRILHLNLVCLYMIAFASRMY